MTEINYTPKAVTLGRYGCKSRLLLNPSSSVWLIFFHQFLCVTELNNIPWQLTVISVPKHVYQVMILGVNYQPFYPKRETKHTCSRIDMNIKCSRILYNSVTHKKSWRIVRLTVLKTQVYHLYVCFRLKVLWKSLDGSYI